MTYAAMPVGQVIRACDKALAKFKRIDDQDEISAFEPMHRLKQILALAQFVSKTHGISAALNVSAEDFYLFSVEMTNLSEEK